LYDAGVTARTWSNVAVSAAICAQVGLCTFAVAGCQSEEQPYVPELDLARLRDAYDHPSASLTVEQVQSLMAEVSVPLTVLALSDRLNFLTAALDQAKVGFEDKGLRAAKGLQLQGRAEVTVSCPGDAGQGAFLNQPPNPANGTLTLRIPISNSQLGPGADGSAASCIFAGTQSALPAWLAMQALGSRRVALNGPIAIDFGTPVTLGEAVVWQPLFLVRGALVVDGLPPVTNFDFRLPASGRVEMRVERPSLGSVVVYAEGSNIGLRERRGVWLCEGMNLQCAPQF
jgi:hypothetical protein